MLEKTSESPLDRKETKPINLKGNQPWIFIGRADAEAEAPILWPSDAKRRLIGKDPDAGKDWKQKEKGTTEDEMFGWHHWLNGHEFEQILGNSEEQGSLVCCSPWGCKESDTTERLKDKWALIAVCHIHLLWFQNQTYTKKQYSLPLEAWILKQRSFQVPHLRCCRSGIELSI